MSFITLVNFNTFIRKKGSHFGVFVFARSNAIASMIHHQHEIIVSFSKETMISLEVSADDEAEGGPTSSHDLSIFERSDKSKSENPLNFGYQDF